MKINLKYYLGKKRITLSEYCKRHNITSYDKIKSLLYSERVEPPDEKVFNRALSKIKKTKPTVEKHRKKSVTRKSKARKRVSYKSSKKTLDDGQL